MIKEETEREQKAAGDEAADGAEHAAEVGRVLSGERQLLPTLAKNGRQLQQGGAGTTSRPGKGNGGGVGD